MTNKKQINTITINLMTIPQLLYRCFHNNRYLLNFDFFMMIDDAFFNQNWVGTCWNRWVGRLTLGARLLCKNKKQKRIGEGSTAQLRPCSPGVSSAQVD